MNGLPPSWQGKRDANKVAGGLPVYCQSIASLLRAGGKSSTTAGTHVTLETLAKVLGHEAVHQGVHAAEKKTTFCIIFLSSLLYHVHYKQLKLFSESLIFAYILSMTVTFQKDYCRIKAYTVSMEFC